MGHRHSTIAWNLVVRRHQEEISALVPQTLFCEEASGGVAKCRRLFSQAFAGTFSGPKKNPVISFFIFCSTTPLLYHTDLRTEAHVPTPRYDQYLTMRAHNHITLVVAVMDSCFVLISIFQATRREVLLAIIDPAGHELAKFKSTALSASSTLGK